MDKIEVGERYVYIINMHGIIYIYVYLNKNFNHSI